MAVDLLAEEVALRASGRPYASVVVTWTRTPASTRVGDRALVTEDGNLIGWVGGSCSEAAVLREARTALRETTARILHIGPPGTVVPGREGITVVPMTCASEGEIEVFIEPHLPSLRIVAIGRAPMLEALVAMAQTVGHHGEVVERDEKGAISLPSLGPSAAVVVATFGRYDEDALAAALATGAGYVGLVASAKRAAGVLEALRRDGVEEESLARVRAPAGLDLGHISHLEIAVAVLADIVGTLSARRTASTAPPPGGDVASGFNAAAPIATATVPMPVDPTPGTPLPVDPVCGMSVDPASAVDRAVHHDVEYVFCSSGCRRAFEADPTAFLSSPQP